MVKMLAVVLIPVIVLTGMTANTFIVSLESYIVSSKISRILYFRYHIDFYIFMNTLYSIHCCFKTGFGWVFLCRYVSINRQLVLL